MRHPLQFKLEWRDGTTEIDESDQILKYIKADLCIEYLLQPSGASG